MDKIVQLYQEALSTHKELTQSDIEFAIPELIKIYGTNLSPILHINLNEYLGKVSYKFNQRLDQAIKNKKVIFDENYWPLHLLTTQEQEELLLLKSIYELALINTLEYLKSVKYQGDLSSLNKRMFLDLCKESNFDCGRYQTIVKHLDKNEVGSLLQINHVKYIDLIDLPKVNLTEENKKKWNKELKLLI